MIRAIAKRALTVNPAAASSINCQQRRTEMVFSRMYPPRLYKKDETRALKRREYVYIMEENKDSVKAPDMEVILTMDIEGLGLAGDEMSVPRRLARNHLLPSGAAVYTSPENKQKYAEINKKNNENPRQSLAAQKTVRQLKALTLPIPMNASKPWTLEKKHLRIAFRRVGVEIEEQCITMPLETVTEPGEIEFTVTVNNIDRIKIQGLVQHFSAAGDVEKIKVFQSTRRTITQMIAETLAKKQASVS